MADYIEVSFIIEPYSAEKAEILSALLGRLGYESFLDSPTGLLAYIKHSEFSEEPLEGLPYLVEEGINYTYNQIPEQNWNIVWETNFDPIIIGKECLVKAPFHKIDKKYPFEIVIEPKMSFGTGHHHTTKLIMEGLLPVDLKGYSFADIGCGTGILAILAAKKGASPVVAVDNDEWAYENAKENILTNNQPQIQVVRGTAKDISGQLFDMVVANINRNVLLSEMQLYSALLKPSGILYTSGYFMEDCYAIENEASRFDLSAIRHVEENNWAMSVFLKS